MITSSEFPFQFERSLQATLHLLQKFANSEAAYIHILKMLYIADREFLAEYGYPITGDQAKAMQHGPVLIRIFNMINDKTNQAETWHRFIQTISKQHAVWLIQNPGNGDLSKASLTKLDDVFTRYGHLTPFQVIELTHEFTEWQKMYTGYVSVNIPCDLILQAQNRDEMIPLADAQVQLQQHASTLQRECSWTWTLLFLHAHDVNYQPPECLHSTDSQLR